MTQAQQEFDAFKSIIRKHQTHEWLALLSAINPYDLLSYEEQMDRTKYDPTILRPFQRIAVADAAIRLSNNYRGSPPSEHSYARAVSHYLGSDILVARYLQEPGKAGRHSLFHGMNRLAYEQFIDNKTRGHLLGRADLLYRKFALDIQGYIGLPFDRLIAFGMAIYAWRMAFGAEQSYFVRESMLNSPDLTINAAELGLFLRHFAATYAKYRAAADEAKLSWDSPYGFRFLRRFPMIEAWAGQYCVPVNALLFELFTEGLYYLAMDSWRAQGHRLEQFHSAFGTELEQYVRDLTNLAGVSTSDCTGIVRKGVRAEFFTTNTPKPIIVEVKKIAYLRDTPYAGDAAKVEKELLKLIEAFQQVENSMNYIPDALGLIITYGTIPFADGFLVRDILKENSPEDKPISAPATISVVSLDEFEHLIAGGPEQLYAILEENTKRTGHLRGMVRNVQYEMSGATTDSNPILIASVKRLGGIVTAQFKNTAALMDEL